MEKKSRKQTMGSNKVIVGGAERSRVTGGDRQNFREIGDSFTRLQDAVHSKGAHSLLERKLFDVSWACAFDDQAANGVGYANKLKHRNTAGITLFFATIATAPFVIGVLSFFFWIEMELFPKFRRNFVGLLAGSADSSRQALRAGERKTGTDEEGCDLHVDES